MIEVFGIAFRIMGLLPSIASTLAYSIPAGPAGLVWGWFLASMFIFFVGLAMADLGSAMPTSGGLYWWTHFFASPRSRNALSFLVGYSNTLGLVGGLCSIDYGFSLMLLSVIVIAKDGDWAPSNGVIYAVFLGCVLCHGVLASSFSKVMGKLQTAFVVMNFVLIFATIIALPIGRASSRNDARFIFATTSNLTNWPTGWAFMLSWLSPIWTIGAFDSCVHMSEEAANATKAVPYGILMSIGSCWLFGWILTIVIAACMSPDLDSILSSPFGQPMAQIYYDALGKKGALALMTMLFVTQFFMGLSITVAASRQTWAFSRDGALPFSRYIRIINQRLGYIPLNAVWFCVLLAVLLGLLTLIGPAAASAVFSLAVAGNNLAVRHLSYLPLSHTFGPSDMYICSPVGHTHPRPCSLGPGKVQAGTFLHRPLQRAHRLDRNRLPGLWRSTVHVSHWRTQSDRGRDELHGRDQLRRLGRSAAVLFRRC